MKTVNKIVTVTLILISLFLMGFLFYIQVVPLKYFILFGLIYVTIIFLLVLFLLRKKTKKRTSLFLNMIGLLMIIGTIAGIYYISKIYNSIDSLNNQTEEINMYYVISLKENSASTIEDLKDKNVGVYTKEDDTLEKALSLLQETISFKQKEYTNIGDMSLQLLNKKEEFLLLKGSTKTILEEMNESFKDKTKIIYEFSVKTKIQKLENTIENPLEEPFNIFISGIDTYGDIMTKSQGDVNIVVTVNPKNHEILLTVIPRDYYVYLHGITESKDKLTHAAYYGIGMSVQTVEDLLETQIPYYIRVNFDTLIRLVDIIGGIDVYSDKTFRAFTNSKVTIQEGMNHMNGTEALAFARERMTYKTGDRHRGENQQAVLQAIIGKVTSMRTLLTNYDAILTQLSRSFETNIETKTMTGYINKQIGDMPQWNIKTYSLNGYDSHNMTYSLGVVRYVMEPNMDTVKEGKRRIQGMLNGQTFVQIGI